MVAVAVVGTHAVDANCLEGNVENVESVDAHLEETVERRDVENVVVESCWSSDATSCCCAVLAVAALNTDGALPWGTATLCDTGADWRKRDTADTRNLLLLGDLLAESDSEIKSENDTENSLTSHALVVATCDLEPTRDLDPMHDLDPSHDLALDPGTKLASRFVAVPLRLRVTLAEKPLDSDRPHSVLGSTDDNLPPLPPIWGRVFSPRSRHGHCQRSWRDDVGC